MKRIYEVSFMMLADRKTEVELIHEALDFMNGLDDDGLLEYVEVIDYESEVDYDSIKAECEEL